MENMRNHSDRHAYLILCHNQFRILCRLLTALDDERNDIYIHVDKKRKTSHLHNWKIQFAKQGSYS